MYKETLKYTSFNDEEVEEDFFFHISKAELIKLQVSRDEGFGEYLKKVVASGKGKDIIETLEMLLSEAIGRKSGDGRRFEKSEEISKDFFQCPGYSDFFMSLATDANKAANFINGVLPHKLIEEANAELAKTNKTENLQLPEGEEDTRPAWLRENREPTQAELTAMSKDELQQAFQWKAQRQGSA